MSFFSLLQNDLLQFDLLLLYDKRTYHVLLQQLQIAISLIWLILSRFQDSMRRCSACNFLWQVNLWHLNTGSPWQRTASTNYLSYGLWDVADTCIWVREICFNTWYTNKQQYFSLSIFKFL